MISSLSVVGAGVLLGGVSTDAVGEHVAELESSMEVGVVFSSLSRRCCSDWTSSHDAHLGLGRVRLFCCHLGADVRDGAALAL